MSEQKQQIGDVEILRREDGSWDIKYEGDWWPAEPNECTLLDEITALRERVRVLEEELKEALTNNAELGISNVELRGQLAALSTGEPEEEKE